MAMRASEEHRLVFWLAGCDIIGGWAEVRQGGNPAGIERIRRGMHGWQTSGAELHLPTWQSLLAEALLALGAVDEADDIADRALVLAQHRAEMFAVAVLLRLKGLIADRRGHAEEGEAHLTKAVMIARQQGARLYELRAVCDLARLMIRRGDRLGARHALEEACRDIGETRLVSCAVEARELLGLLG
jgi:predicted ATPase